MTTSAACGRLKTSGLMKLPQAANSPPARPAIAPAMVKIAVLRQRMSKPSSSARCSFSRMPCRMRPNDDRLSARQKASAARQAAHEVEQPARAERRAGKERQLAAGHRDHGHAVVAAEPGRADRVPGIGGAAHHLIEDQRHDQRDDGEKHRRDPAVEAHVAEHRRHSGWRGDAGEEAERQTGIDGDDAIDVAADAEQRCLAKDRMPAMPQIRSRLRASMP